MEGPRADPEQTERLLFLSSQADDKFSVTINEFYASVRQQCQITAALHGFANGNLSLSQSNRLVVASQEATTNLQDRMRALYQSFESQKDAKARALSALASEHGFFKMNNALLLEESHELIAHDNELQKMHSTTHSECEDLKKQVASLESERTSLLKRATTAEKQQNLLQVDIDHKTRQYNQSQTSVLGLEKQVRQLDRSLLVDRTNLEDEKLRNAGLQTSVEKLQSNVESLEQELSQSNDCLKVHVEHVDTQQTVNDGLKRQVQELESSLETARRGLDDKERKIMDLENSTRELDSRINELEQTLCSAKDCLAIEKSLSNAGQVSTGALTLKVHELEDALKAARQDIRNEIDRHVAQQQNLERSLGLSNNALEAYMDRCKSQQASIESLSQEAQRLESSLEVAQKALEDEIQRHAIRQTSAEELETTAKQLKASLHVASDGLQDEKSRCNVYQASIVSLTANVRSLEQSLHLAHMNLEKQKRNAQNSIFSAESNVQRLEKTLDLTRKDLKDKAMRCVAPEASVIHSDELRKELEKSLQVSRDDLEAKVQLYNSQQPYIDSLKNTERDLQRSLLKSQMETRAQKDRCTTQQSSIAQMAGELQELKVELESTRGRLERAKQLYSTQDDGSGFGLNTQQLEDGSGCDTAPMDLAQGQSTPDESSRSQPINPAVSGDTLASGEDSQLEVVKRLHSELAETTQSLQLYQNAIGAITDHSLERHLQLPCTTFTQDLSKLRRDSERATEVVRNCPALLRAQTETRYNSMVVETILQQLLSDESCRTSGTSDSDTDSEAIEVPSRFIGARYLQSNAKEMQNRGSEPSPILYEESCGESNCDGDSSETDYNQLRTNCQGRYVVKYLDEVCLNAMQTERLRTLVWNSAQNAHWNARCPKWLESTTRVKYPGESEEKTLAGLSLIEQIVDSMLNPPGPRRRPRRWVKSCPPDPLRGLKVIKQRVALYWYKCYATASAKHASTRDDAVPQTNTVRKRHISVELDHESQRHSKRHKRLSAADAIIVSKHSDSSPRQSNSEVKQDQRLRGSSTASAIEVDNASDSSLTQSDSEFVSSDQWSIIDKGNAVSMNLWTLHMHQPRKLRLLEYIQCSPWAHDTREDARRFVKSLTPALHVNVISRLATLSSFYPVQQVVLHINLRQLDQMLAFLNGSWIIPLVSNGFKIGESHIKSFSKLCFNKARLDELLDYPLNSARFGRHDDERTLGLHSSGRFKIVRRRDPPNLALTLRARFDTETIATMKVSKSTGPDETGDSDEVTDHSGENHSDCGDAAKAQTNTLEYASSPPVQDLPVERSVTDQEDGSSRKQIRHPASKKADSPHDRNPTGTTLTTASSSDVGGSGGGGDSERAELHGHSSDASKDQGTVGAYGRSKRTPKPSRRATEAASARRR